MSEAEEMDASGVNGLPEADEMSGDDRMCDPQTKPTFIERSGLV
jgi:hypothetical protein